MYANNVFEFCFKPGDKNLEDTAMRTVTEGLGLDVRASFFNRCFGLLQSVFGAFPGSFHQLLHLQAKIKKNIYMTAYL